MQRIQKFAPMLLVFAGLLFLLVYVLQSCQQSTIADGLADMANPTYFSKALESPEATILATEISSNTEAEDNGESIVQEPTEFIKPTRTAEPIYPTRSPEELARATEYQAEVDAIAAITETAVPPTVTKFVADDLLDAETIVAATETSSPTQPSTTNTPIPSVSNTIPAPQVTNVPVTPSWVAPATIWPTAIPVTQWPTETATAVPTWPTSTPLPTATEIIWPTHTPLPPATAVVWPTNTAVPAAPVQSATSAPAVVQQTWNGVVPAPTYLERFGLGGDYPEFMQLMGHNVPVGYFLNWKLTPDGANFPQNVNFWPMVRLSEAGMIPSWWDLEQAVRARPNAIFLIGNEMDVPWQDGITAPRYAVLYHDIYHFIKKISPNAKVAIGGVSQSTPLRRQYLDNILNSYQSTYGAKMPIDVMNVHGFILREERNGWGVGIPPGMNVNQGTLYEIEDHANINIFRQNIVDFRAWMAQRGYGDKPLLVSEYGILMPPDFGFGPDVVNRFMTGSFDVMLNTTNGNGYSVDGNRLVQWWVWYSIFDQEPGYPAGNLINVYNGQMTSTGYAWKNYLSR